MGQTLTIIPSKVGGGPHGAKVLLSLMRLPRRAGELPVWEIYPILDDCPLHLDQRVCTDLMSQTSRAGMNHHRHLALEQTEDLCGLHIVDLGDRLDLQEMIA